jgi:hypothetical protein
MYRNFTCKALCAIVLVFSQSREALLTPDLVDRLVTVISLAEFQDRDFDQTVNEIRELLPRSPLREQSYELMKDALLGVGLKAEAEIVLRTGLKAFPEVASSSDLSRRRSIGNRAVTGGAEHPERSDGLLQPTGNSEPLFFSVSETSSRD